MGLDMYLYKKYYVYNYGTDPAQRVTVSMTRNGQPLPGFNPEKVKHVVEEIGYWRKANHIHRWFVKNVQNGQDDGETHYVDPEQLGELLRVVGQVLSASQLVPGEVHNGSVLEPGGGWKKIMEEGKVIANPAVAQELLPTQSGFFFGNTDYDEWYYQDLVRTQEILEEALKEDDGTFEFEYRASW